MPIQNLNNNQSFTSNSLESRPKQNNVIEKIQIEKAPKTSTFSIESLNTVFSQELKSTLDNFSANRGPVSQTNQSPLQQYQSVSDFEEIDGLSNVIGIDITV